MLLNTFSSVPHRDVSIMFKDKKVLSFHLFPCFAQLSLLWKNAPAKKHKNSMCSMRPWTEEVCKGGRKGLKPGERLYVKIHMEAESVALANPRARWDSPRCPRGTWSVKEGRLLSVTYCLGVWLQGSTKQNRGEKHLCPCTQTHTPHYRRILINCVSLTQRQEFTEQFTPYLC